MGIYGNAAGGFGMPKTIVLVDDNENEITGVVTDDVVVFDATSADVRINKTFAGSDGVQTGENTITYRTQQGIQFIPAGSLFSITLSKHNTYDYTKLQCIISPFNTSTDDSCAVDKAVINDYVYASGSANKISDVTKNHDTASIDLNITNDTADTYLIRFFTYKEEE